MSVEKIPTSVTKEWLDGYTAEKIKAMTGGLSPEEHAAKIKSMQDKIDALTAVERESAIDKELSIVPKSYQKMSAPLVAADKELNGLGLFACRLVRLLGAKQAKCFSESAKDYALKQWNDRGTADALDRIEQETKTPEIRGKALASQILGDGGALLTEEFTATIIPLLRAQSNILNRMRRLPTNSLSGRQPRHATAVSASWVGENIETNASQGALDDVAWSLKKLSVLQAASNDFLLMSGIAGDQWLRQDMITTARLRMALSVLRGLGTGFEPKGVRYTVDSANVAARTQAAATSTLAEIVHDHFDMLEDVEGNNVDPSSSIWVMPSRTKNGLAQLLDGNGNFVFMQQINAGNLLGYPFEIDNQIPRTLGGGDETEHYLIPLQEWLFVEGQMLGIKAYDGAAYRDSGGNLVVGAAADNTLFRLNMYADLVAYHNEAGSIRTAVDWGT